MKNKKIIGLNEKITFFGKKEKKTISAKIDTGASRSSIDEKLAKKLRLGPIIKYTTVKQAEGKCKRPVIKTKIKFAGKEMTSTFTIAKREHMKYRALIGVNILKKGFLIDPTKK